MTEVITVGVSELHNDYKHLREVVMRGGIVYIRNGWTGDLQAALVSVADAERIETDKLADNLAAQKQEGPH